MNNFFLSNFFLSVCVIGTNVKRINIFQLIWSIWVCVQINSFKILKFKFINNMYNFKKNRCKIVKVHIFRKCSSLFLPFGHELCNSNIIWNENGHIYTYIHSFKLIRHIVKRKQKKKINHRLERRAHVLQMVEC